MNVSIARSPDVFQALARVYRAGLFDWDETTSQVQILLDSESNKVRQVWLATDLTSGRDVGMAMLSDPTPDSQGLQVLNLFVDDNHRGQGLGQSLIGAVLEEHSASTVAAYYTTNAVRLYQRAGFPPAKVHFNAAIAQLWEQGQQDAARKLFVETVLAERADFDRLEAEYQARPRPRLG